MAIRLTDRRGACAIHAAATSLLAFVWMFGGVSPVAASTVEQVHLSEMLSRSELIFEGRVIGHSIELVGSGMRTWVEFAVEDVVKGPPVGRTLRVAFLGGSHDGVTFEVVGLRVPEVGEHGIYFIESVRRLLVNPIYGWDQGRLRILHDAKGRERVVDARGRPVVGLRGESPGSTSPALRAIGTGAGPADGVEVDANAPLDEALTKTGVKDALARFLLSVSEVGETR